MGYQRWYKRMLGIALADTCVGRWMQSFAEFPPRQKIRQLKPSRKALAIIIRSFKAEAVEPRLWEQL